MTKMLKQVSIKQGIVVETKPKWGNKLLKKAPKLVESISEDD